MSLQSDNDNSLIELTHYQNHSHIYKLNPETFKHIIEIKEFDRFTRSHVQYTKIYTTWGSLYMVKESYREILENILQLPKE